MMMKKETAGVQEKACITGEMLNERLDSQMLDIERTSILLEDAKLEPYDVMSLDRERMDKLMELLSAYEAFLEHFRHTTQDMVTAVKDLTTAREQCYGGDCDDMDVDPDEDIEELPE